MLVGLVFCEMLSQYPQSAFRVLRGSPGGSAAVCDPNPPRPFARSKIFGSYIPSLFKNQKCIFEALED